MFTKIVLRHHLSKFVVNCFIKLMNTVEHEPFIFKNGKTNSYIPVFNILKFTSNQTTNFILIIRRIVQQN